MANETDHPAQLVEIMTSLAAVMRQETHGLESGLRSADLGELAQAKARLVGTLDERLARAERQEPGWMTTLRADVKQALADAAGELRAASMVNAALLERHIELSNEIMEAICAEAKRASGSRAYAYGASGTLARADMTTPISFNSEF